VAARHPLLFCFVFDFLKKISIFIYFLIILFIKMDTCRILIGLTWR
jgi:hypothetical protein